MDSIVVADKNTAQLSQTAWGDISLSRASLVQLPVSPDAVASVSRSGQNLVLTLKSGERLTIANFFVVDQDGVGNDLVFVGDDGTLWQASYDADAFSGFTFDEVASLDQLMAGIGEAGNATQTFAIAGLGLLGLGGAAAAAGGAAGGGGGGGDGEPGDTLAPARPTDLLVSADGLRLSGRGEAGTTVNVRDVAGNLIGSGTVGSDGRFDLALDTPQANGEALTVDLTDAAGNVSEPGTVNAPDITPPAAPTDLAIDGAGTVLSGRAEPGSTVQVRGADGSLLGSAVSGSDGTFSVTLQPPQSAGQALQVSATDAAGNTSPASTISAPDLGTPPDTTAPDAPTDLVVGDSGRQLTGRGEAGTGVTVRDAQGNVIATGVVAADGTFSVVLDPAVIDGSSLQVDLTDAAGNVSEPASVASPDLIAPAQPTELALAEGVTLTGLGEPGATVQVRDASGAVIGTGVVGADGRFSVELDPAQANGEFIDVRLVDAAGNESVPLAFQAPDITAPEAVTDVVVSADGLTVSGRGEIGASVEIRDAQGTLIGTGVVGANGAFVIALDSAVAAGDVINLVQTDAAGNASPATDFTVPTTPAPSTPTELALNADGSELSGLASPGNRVEVHGADGTLLGSAIAAEDGSFTITLVPPQANGEALEVVAINIETEQSSIPASITAPDITPPLAPSELAVSADGTVLTGRGEPGSTVRVVDAQGNELGTAVVNAAGSFAVTLVPAQTEGQSLEATAQDAAGNVSPAASVIAPNLETPIDTTPPDAPIDLVVSAGGTQLSGRGEAGTTVNVRDAEGNVIATGVVAADGTFSVVLDPAVIDGSSLQVDLTDAAGNVSEPASVASPDLIAPAQPTDLSLAEGVTLTGLGEPGATVQVRDASGVIIGSGVVGVDGRFTVELDPAQANGEFIDVRLVDAAGNVSTPLAFQAPDITAPEAVTDVVVSADGLTVSGRGEIGASVEVRDAAGTVIGTGVVGANGAFVIALDGAVAAGDVINLVQTDAAGNASPVTDFTVPSTPAPTTPTELALNADGSELSGLATPGNRVEVHGADGTLLGSGVAAEDGSFSITLVPPQANGEALEVVAINTETEQTSIPASITAPDITPPLAPSELAVSADGSVLTGRGEPGSTIRVTDAQGNQLGTAVVNAAGSFAVTLVPAQTEGQNLEATA
ncbi:Ig-like domain-containing protein, partial [Pseudomonas cremoricolorata]|uniref:Ig-like domain-containing protein n=1 Tax=Pseudomonas cremoricolorata TaxID=157783 RepID=UPI0005346E9E